MPEKTDLSIDALLAEFERLRTEHAPDDVPGLTRQELMSKLGIGTYQFNKLIEAARKRGELRCSKKESRNAFGDRQMKHCYWIEPAASTKAKKR